MEKNRVRITVRLRVRVRGFLMFFQPLQVGLELGLRLVRVKDMSTVGVGVWVG